MEAMASGLPVIATNVGGNSELVRHGETGFLVPPNQPELLADRMCQLAESQSRKCEFGAKSRQIAKDEFSLSTMVNKYMALYRK